MEHELKELKNAEGLALKLNDVYRFYYNEEYRKKHSYSDHCFDGQFIVKQRDNGTFYFMDTYWASKHDGFKHWQDNKWKDVEEALEQGDLTFICNLDDVEEIREHEQVYYADEDLFNLSYQHGCYKFYTKKKTATRNSKKMEATLIDLIESEKYQIKSLERKIKDNTEKLEKLKSGDLSIWI